MPQDPATYDNTLLYLPSDTSKMFTDAAGTVPAGVDDFVRIVNSGVSGAPTWDSITDARRPQLVDSSGALQFGTLSSSNRYLRLPGDSGAYTKVIHETGSGYGMCSVKLDSSPGSGNRVIYDCTGLSATALGFRLQVFTSGVVWLRVNNGNSGSPVLSLISTVTIEDNAWHRIKWHLVPNPGVSWLSVDGAITLGIASATLGTGNAAAIMIVGDRSALTAPFPGQLRSIWIGTGRPSASQEAEWDAANPLGTLSGNPLLTNGVLTFALNKDRAYNPITPRYFSGFNVYSAVATDGAVFDDNAADDSPDGTSWRGGPHGRETVDTVTIGGQPIQDGVIYESGELVRNTQIGDSYTAVQKLSLSGATVKESVRLTRLGDGLAINPSYPFRFGRALTLAPYLALAADGVVLADSTVGDSDGIVNMPAGTRGVAQFSSTLGVMVLSVLTKGHGSDEQPLIVGSANDRRLYVAVTDARRNPAEGVSFDMAATTKYFNTDSGSWKDLAVEELLKITQSGGGIYYHSLLAK